MASFAAAPNPAYPAVYSVVLDPVRHVAFVRALFYDESLATAANGAHRGTTVKLGLTDPDSNEVVPPVAPRFGGDFMLSSQGDREQIYVHGAGTWYQHLSVLPCPSRSTTPRGPRPGTGSSTAPTTAQAP